MVTPDDTSTDRPMPERAPTLEATPGALSPATHAPRHDTVLRLGLDIGSTTIKLVLLETGAQADGDRLHFQTYRRHHADIAGELDAL